MKQRVVQITRSSLFWWGIWTLAPLFSFVCFMVGRFMPAVEMWQIALQAILLSIPPWALACWPFLGGLCAWRRKGVFRWIWLFTPWWMGVPPSSTSPTPLSDGISVFVANVNAFTGRNVVLKSHLSRMPVDVLVLLERRVDDVPGFRRIADDFDPPHPRVSHHSSVYVRENSLHQPVAHVTEQIGSTTMAMPVALVRLKPGICLVGVHAPPPVPIDSSGMAPYIAYLTAHIQEGKVSQPWGVCEEGDGVVVMGDLNAVPHSQPHLSLLDRGLIDVQADLGLFGLTWPNGGDWLKFPVFRLDHVLLGRVQIQNLNQVPIPDSDHKGLSAVLGSASTNQ